MTTEKKSAQDTRKLMHLRLKRRLVNRAILALEKLVALRA
jgi:hypothetical protein